MRKIPIRRLLKSVGPFSSRIGDHCGQVETDESPFGVLIANRSGLRVVRCAHVADPPAVDARLG